MSINMILIFLFGYYNYGSLEPDIQKKEVARYIKAISQEKNKTKGKIRLSTLLKSGKELKIFSVKKEDLKKCYKYMNENPHLNLSISDLKIIIRYGEEVADLYCRAKTYMGRRVKMTDLKFL